MQTEVNPKQINEIKKLRTFAIISNPDAGKTTHTEKLLLFGGAILCVSLNTGLQKAPICVN